ncbi:MAG: hypothetical protein J0H44_15570 [Alphaproteobacteria bacterium]|jgi:hypothetical protein|nr:hypothetical protein [Alphaproteobacteria bacterium]
MVLASAFGLVGFALRWVFSFGVFLWLYVFVDVLYSSFSTPPFIQSFDQALSAFAIAYAFAFVAVIGPNDVGILPLAYFLVATAALVMAVFWGRICRRRCGPAKEWF